MKNSVVFTYKETVFCATRLEGSFDYYGYVLKILNIYKNPCKPTQELQLFWLIRLLFRSTLVNLCLLFTEDTQLRALLKTNTF